MTAAPDKSGWRFSRTPPAPPEDATSVELRHDRGAIDRLRDEITARCLEEGFDQAATFAIRLAFEEAVSNAFRHGAGDDPDAIVRITWEVSDGRVFLRVDDQGPGFDPDAVPDPTLDENLERLSGRGLLLMRAYMTEVSFNDTGNAITLVRRRDHGRKHASPPAGSRPAT
ncbi:MAG: ATP-binding protein [Phycisphaerales bacterium]